MNENRGTRDEGLGTRTASGSRVPSPSSLVPARRRRVARLLAMIAGASLLVFLLTPTGCYLSRAGWEEAKILAGRRQIVRLVDDARTDPATRARLRLVLAARGFAADSLGLRTGESFTTYSHLERDTLVLRSEE